MKLPLQITFHGFDHSNAVEAAIRKRAEKLETFHHFLMACRVVVGTPHRHHHRGNLFHVRIDVTVPRAELVVGKNSGDEGAHKDVYVAIRDAFDSMERLVREHAQKHRVRVHEKERALPMHGKVLRLMYGDDGYGFGFLLSAEGREVYFHMNSVLNGKFDRLSVGDEVRFAEEEGLDGAQASTVEPVGKDGRHLMGK